MAEEYTDHIAPHTASAEWAVPPVDDILPRTLGDLWAMPPAQQALATEILAQREADAQHDCYDERVHDDCVTDTQARQAYRNMEEAREALREAMEVLET